MTKFVFVYYSDAMVGESTEEGKAAWGAWFGSLSDKLVDAGNPFNAGGKAVEKSGISTIEKRPATGYTIVNAESMDEATAMAKGCPLLDVAGGSIGVYEALPM